MAHGRVRIATFHRPLVGKPRAIDGLAASAVACCEVAALGHEAADDPVYWSAAVVQPHMRLLAVAPLASAQAADVFGRFGHKVVEQLHNDPAYLLPVNGNVKEHPRSRHRTASLSFLLLLLCAVFASGD